MKHDNVTELHRLESPFKALDCGISLCAMTHFEQHSRLPTAFTLPLWIRAIRLRSNTRRWIVGSTGVQGELGAPVWRRS